MNFQKLFYIKKSNLDLKKNGFRDYCWREKKRRMIFCTIIVYQCIIFLSVEEVPCGVPFPPLNLISRETRIAIGERGKDEERDEEGDE